ncbi:MAG: helix-turn-helix transcriptional regulator [Labilithrix sp.]|nr:helix-turn-helix transcriptional regulator [Labilithrix sp.]
MEAGLRQADLAERAGMADATLSRIERNRLVPSIALAKRIADALGVPVDSLLNASAKPPKARSLRPSEARLLATVRELDDAAVDDVVRGLRLIMAAARRGDAGVSVSDPRSARRRRA